MKPGTLTKDEAAAALQALNDQVEFLKSIRMNARNRAEAVLALNEVFLFLEKSKRVLLVHNSLIETAVHMMRTVADNMEGEKLEMYWAKCNIHELRSTADELEKVLDM